MAVYSLAGNIYGAYDYLGQYWSIRVLGDVVITDYPDRIEGYVDTRLALGYSSTAGTAFDGTYDLIIDGKAYVKSGIWRLDAGYTYQEKPAIERKYFTIYKTHASQVLNVSIRCRYDSQSTTVLTQASGSYTIPAKTNYAVTLKGNGATGWSDWTMTKWYNENLVLAPTTPPVLSGYTLNGWTSTVAKASAGQIDYVAGGNYTANEPATLYAVWELTYTKPAITRFSIERCKANGDLDDEGGYAKVTVDWEIYKSDLSRFYGGDTYPYQNNSASCQIQVGTFTKTVTSTSASGTFSVVLGNGSFSTDNQYSASITLTDTQTIKTDHSVTVAGTLSTSFFPMDFNSMGTALGIFMPVPDTDEGVYLGKDLFLPLDTNAGSGTDKEIYDALVALGWTDVIV